MDHNSRDIVDAVINELIEDGYVYMTWSDEKNDFVFGLTEKGVEVTKLPDDHNPL